MVTDRFLADHESCGDLGVGQAFEVYGPRHEVFVATLDALRPGPTVVILEDVHWADEATLDLLRPCSSEKARTSDVFPMPASPLTSTSRPFPAAAAARCSPRSAR